VAVGPLDRKAEVDTQRSDRRLVAEPEAGAVAEVVDREGERLHRDLPGVEEHVGADGLGDRMPELDRALDEAQSADRIAVDHRTDVAALVAAHRVDASGIEPFVERDVLRAAVWVFEAEPGSEREGEAPRQRLIATPLQKHPDEGHVAAEESAD